LAFKDPTTAIMNLTFDSLMQNERFQKTLDRFMSIFMDVFGDFAEGIAIVFEALVDMVELFVLFLR
jgi:hypothetical protein